MSLLLMLGMSDMMMKHGLGVYTRRRNGQATGRCLTAECSKCLEML